MLFSARASKRRSFGTVAVCCVLGGLLSGCAGDAQLSSSEDADAGPVGPAPGTFNPGVPDMTPTEADAATPVNPPPGARLDGGTPGPSDGEAPPPPPDDGPALPCEIATILRANCSNCHGVVPQYGAPMSLVTWEDLQAPARSDPNRKVYDLVVDRMEDEQRAMPPPPNPPVDEADLAKVRDWAASGGLAGKACDGPAPPDAGVDDELPPPSPDCDYVFELRAHGLQPDSGYPVPPLTDYYVNFTFKVPWNGSVHGVSFYPLTDDKRVLHHWLLYAAPLGAGLDGASIPGIGMHPGESLIAGWAPGGDPRVMPDDVGLELPDGPFAHFTLEMHYHNDQGILDSHDRSGVRVCATSHKRPNTAAVHLLGTEILPMVGAGEFKFTGICTPILNILAQRPVHILTSSPHLHRRGRHIKTVIHHMGGGEEVLLDEPFDFDNQISYATPATVNPGDWLTTTCTYENPGGIAGFGIRTEDEMCQNYITAWPVGALDTGGSIILENHACML